jgi:hypothetical protein
LSLIGYTARVRFLTAPHAERAHTRSVADTLHARFVRRASELLGGHDVLAERLGVSEVLVRMWLGGKLGLPQRVFFEVIDLLEEADPEFRAVAGNDIRPSRGSAE